MASNPVPSSCDIAIVGGGMVGASLACLLAATGPDWRIVLLESRPMGKNPVPNEFDARSTALARGSLEILRRAGIWPDLAQHCTAIEQVHVSDQGHLGGHLIDDGMPVGQVVENARLGQRLHQRLQACANIEFCAPVQVASLKPRRSGARVQLGNGDTLDCQLAVIADGEDSPLRRALGIDAQITDYHQTALVANLSFSRAHRGLAYERFTRNGPLALLPLGESPQSRRAALIWTQPPDRAQACLDLSDTRFLAALQQAFGWRLGRFERVGSRQIFPLRLVTASEQVRSHVLLAGNAAHFLHPVAGQGFNLSLRDCAGLADTLAGAAERGQNLGELAVLQGYMRARSRDQKLTTEFSHGLTRLFSNANPGPVLLRHLGLLGLELLPPASRALAAQTMGTADHWRGQPA